METDSTTSLPSSMLFTEDAWPKFSGRWSIVFFLVAMIALFFGGHYALGEMRTEHLVLSSLVLGLYLSHSKTRLFLILALPFLLQGVFYDFLRYIPWEWLQPIYVKEPFEWEQALFAIGSGSETLLPHEYVQRWLHPFWDVFLGVVYNSMYPVAFFLFFLTASLPNKWLACRYGAAFGVMYLLTFPTYLLLPAAPPWYVAKFGFAPPAAGMTGDPAGLVRFDQLLGIELSQKAAETCPFVFGAIPSMHSGITLLAFIYSLKLPKKRWAIFFGAYNFSMWFSVLYFQHHYVIDIVVGALFALVGFVVVEFFGGGVVKRIYGALIRVFYVGGPRPFLK